MEALSRQEYPAMLDRSHPAGAVSKLNDRVKRIGKINSEIADWLQERRKVEDAYVAGLKKLARRPLLEVGGDLGIFDAPWKKIISSTDDIASSHALLAQRIEKDVEQPLRTFATNNREMQAMTTTQGNLAAMAKEVEEAQDKSEKLNKKGGKASAQKVDAAVSKLQAAKLQWESQAPFIFETLQALDETRLNHLRDVLTQYETHESDQIERSRVAVEQTLSTLLEIDTAQEIRNWAQANASGKPTTDRRTRQLSNAASSIAGSASIQPSRSVHADSLSEHSGKHDGESKLKSRFGTMLSRRRQSMHGGFGRAPSPSKGFVPFGRNSGSREGRPSPSPRASSNNLREIPAQDNRLSSLAESPPTMSPTSQLNGNTNGMDPDSILTPVTTVTSLPNATNGIESKPLPDLIDAQSSPGPAPSHLEAIPKVEKDSEGFTVPAAMNDPISQAQQEASQDGEQSQFKLNIRKEPIPEQDEDAQAALSNVANTLRSSQMITPNRKAGTLRGRRDVRNTIYAPNSLEGANMENIIPPSPGVPSGRTAALAALSSGDHAPPIASDTTSIASGHSLTNHPIHPEMLHPGLNASIIETVTATFENGEVKTSKISGEIALTYNKSDDSSLPSSGNEIIRINNFPNLEAIGPNRTFIHPVSSEKPDEFTIGLSPILQKSSVAFTYRVHIDEANLTSQGPLLLKPAWKPQGDKLALVIEYSLNPSCGSGPLTFNNLVLVAVYEGAKASGCQTKPTGTHIKDKSLVYWRLGDVTLTTEWQKVICRFVGADGTAPEPGHIESRWEVQGGGAGHQLGSGISLSRQQPAKGKEKEETANPFEDESIATSNTASAAVDWVELETSKKFISGKYEAKQA